MDNFNVICRYPYPEKLKAERDSIVEAYCAIDPDGDWNEAEWNVFFNERASEELKDFERGLDEVCRLAEENGVLI